MKKLVLTFAVIFAATTIANAQLFVGGNLGFGVQSNGKTETVSGGVTTTVEPVKTLNFTIAPRIGYNLNDKMAVGLDLSFGMNNDKYPDNYFGLTETNSSYSQTTMGAGLFFRYYLMEVGQFSLFAEAAAGLQLGNGKQEYTIGSTTTTVDAPKTTDILVSIVPGISYKVNEKLQFDAYLGICEVLFSNTVTKSETTFGSTTTTTTVKDNYFGLGINNNRLGSIFQVGVVYNF